MNRNYIFDAVKTIAIWFVVLGHCIQLLSGLDYWNDGLFQFIYSFHMPLFFMVSGFFFASSTKLTIREFLWKKCLTLLLPCFVWGVIVSVSQFQSWTALAKDILLPAYWPFWFFKGLFLVQLVAYLSMRIAERIGGGARIQLCSSILISLIVYMLPYMGVARVMIPVFWIGYVMKMYYEQYIKYHHAIGLVALAIFVGLYYFWNGETMHYSASASVTLYHVILGKHGYTIMNLLWLAYRIVLGVTGSLVIISVMHEFQFAHNKYVSIVGSSTAGIYVLHTYFLQYVLASLLKENLNNWSLAEIYGLMLVVSVLCLGVVTWLYQILRKSSIIDMILFGCGDRTKINRKINKVYREQ